METADVFVADVTAGLQTIKVRNFEKQTKTKKGCFLFVCLKNESVLCIICDLTKGFYPELDVLAKKLNSGARKEGKDAV